MLLLCEHDPVVTLGRSARPEDVLATAEDLAAAGIGWALSTRGGRATYHGPGQLVAYPVVRLRRGVLAHVQALGQAAAEVARQCGVAATWRRDPVGVYVGNRKLAAIGVHIQRHVAIHGLALNVTEAACLAPRKGLIVPCGEAHRALTSLAEECGRPLSIEELLEPLAQALGQALGRPVGPIQAAGVGVLLSRTDPMR